MCGARRHGGGRGSAGRASTNLQPAYALLELAAPAYPLRPPARCPAPRALSQDGAARMLRYLRDAAFLDDAQSAALDARLLTYNPALDVLG